MTSGFPSEATTDAVQANVVAARYDEQRLKISRITTFTPKSSQDVTVTFTNTTGAAAKGVKLSIVPRKGWAVSIPGFAGTTKAFAYPIPAGATVSATFKVTSTAVTEGGFLSAKAEWAGAAAVTSAS